MTKANGVSGMTAIRSSLTYRVLKMIDAWYRESGTARAIRSLERMAVAAFSGSVFGRLASGQWPGSGVWEGSFFARLGRFLFEGGIRWARDVLRGPWPASIAETLAAALDHSLFKGLVYGGLAGFRQSLTYRVGYWLLTEPGAED